MADFVTHHLFGEESIRDLNPWAKKICGYYGKAFHWGLQGPDFLMMHHFATGGDEISSMGVTMHMDHVDRMFYTLCKTLAAVDYSALSRSMSAYFFGFICHYALDSVIHPYVFSMVEKNIENGVSDDDQMLHLKVETDIDTVLYKKRTGRSIRMFRGFDSYETLPIGNEHRLLYGTIEKLYIPVLKEVYACPITKKEIDESLDTTLWVEKMQYNNVRMALLLVNSFSKDEKTKKRNTAVIKYEEPKWDALNQEHNPWSDFQGHEHTDSVEDMFLQAEEKACGLIDKYTGMLTNHHIEEIHFPVDFEGEINHNDSML